MNRDPKLYAGHALRFALNNLSSTLPCEAERELCCKALAAPTQANLRALLEVSRGRRWHDLIESSLVEVGLAYAGEALRGVADE